MRKIFSFILALFLLIGCAGETKEQSIPTQNEDNEVMKLEELITSNEIILDITDEQKNSLNEDICKISLPLILSNNAEAKAFNEQMNELYKMAKETTVYEEDGTLFTAHFIWNEVYLNTEVISILIHQKPMQWQSDAAYETIDVYNYDWNNGHFLTNEELLKKFNLEISLLENKLSDVLTNNFYSSENVPCDEFKIPKDEPYLYETQYDTNIKEILFHPINNQDKMYIKENNVHIILNGAIGMHHKDFDIKIE